MTSTRLELPPPILGLSDDLPAGKQQPGTSSELVNVRATDPVSGRTRLSQRAGWSPFTTEALAGGKPVTALGQVSVDLPKRLWTPQESGVAGPGDWAFVDSAASVCLAVATDREGDVYFLGQTGTVIKRNADGEELARITPPYVDNEEPVRRLFIDPLTRALFVASRSMVARQGHIYRMRLEDADEHRYAFSWSLSAGGYLRDFTAQYGTEVYAAVEPVGGIDQTVLRGWTGINTSLPVEVFARSAPHPIGAIARAPSGAVLVTSPANAQRGQWNGGGGWTVPAVAWSPHELEGQSGYISATRLHAWFDPTYGLGAPGDLAPGLFDHRYLATTVDEDNPFLGPWGWHRPNGEYSFYPPFDTVTRIAWADWTNTVDRDAPHVAQIGPEKALYFNGSHFAVTDPPPPPQERPGEALRSNANWDTNGKQDTDGDGFPNKEGRAITQAAVMPGTPRSVYTTFMLVSFGRTTKASCILSQSAEDGVRFGLFANADGDTVYPSQTNEGANGKLTWYTDRATGSAVNGNGKIATADMEDLAITGDPDSSLDNEQNLALVVFQHAGTYFSAGGGVNPDSQRSFLRVNGYYIDKFDMLRADATGYASATLMGAPYRGPIPNPATDLCARQEFQGTDFASFTGTIHAILTVLGGTADEDYPNERPTQYTGTLGPTTSGNIPAIGATHQWSDMSAENYGADPVAYTMAASEIEQIEGWLCHKHGCANILKFEGTPGVSGSLQNAHPFSRSFVPTGIGGPLSQNTDELALGSVDAITARYGPGGALAWATTGGGMGRDVIADEEDAVYTVGLHSPTEQYTLRKMLDKTTEVDPTGDGTWQFDDGDLDLVSDHDRLAVDAAGEIWWARSNGYPKLSFRLSTQPFHNDTLVISNLDGTDTTYRWRNTLAGCSAYDVLIGADEEASIAALQFAINGWESGEGVLYCAATVAHPDARCLNAPDGSLDQKLLIGRFRSAVGNGIELDTSATTGGVVIDGSTVTLGETVEGRNNALERRSAEDGSELLAMDFGSYLSPNDRGIVTGVAFPPTQPYYPNEDHRGNPEHAFLSIWPRVTSVWTLFPPADDTAQRSYRYMNFEQVIAQDASPRDVGYYAVADGSLYRVERLGAPALVEGGERALQKDSPWTRLLTFNQQLFMFDGQRYAYYDPRRADLGVRDWKSTSSGVIPPGAKLGVVWNQRIVLARTEDDPSNVHMGRRGDAFDWNTNPYPANPLAAISGAGLGGTTDFRKHDLINALIPASDDLLLIGGDSTVSRLTGDPGLGGQLDLLTDKVGLAFGTPWTKDPFGNVYAFAAQGGLYRFGSGGNVERLSLHSIERRLRDLDLRVYDVRLVWSREQEGIHLFLVPKTVGGVPVTHYFFDAKNGGWFEDELDGDHLQPWSCSEFDGDAPDDRVTVIGCQDGFLRYVDLTATNDDGVAIDSRALIGPLIPTGMAGDVRFSKLEAVLASDQSRAWIEVMTNDVPDFLEQPAARLEAPAGYQGALGFHAKGSEVWLRVRNGALTEGWSLESLALMATSAGRRSVRG